MTDEEFHDEYARLAHAIQTGIAYDMQAALGGSAPENAIRMFKHHRVGIDTNKSDLGSIARLLIEKGIFTEDEYKKAIIDGLKVEKAMYEERLSQNLGKKITLA